MTKRRAIPLAELRPITQQVDAAVSVGDLVELERDQVGVIDALDERTRTARVELVAGATRRGVDKAADSFREFTGMDPGSVVTLPAPEVPSVAWWLGNLLAVEYETEREGKRERYRHVFKRQARPALGVTIDAQQLVILGGGYRVTDRGITDD